MACKAAGCEDPSCCPDAEATTTIMEKEVTNVDGVVETTTRAGSLVDGEFVATLGDMVEVKLPDGNRLHVGANSIENNLINFIVNGTIDETNTSKNWLSFDRLQFESGKSSLKKSSEEQLKNMVSILKAYPEVSLKLGGYTDNTGDSVSNQTLSAERARHVMSRLVENGIASNRLEADGYGQNFPVGDNATEIGRAMNRRIDVKVSKK